MGSAPQVYTEGTGGVVALQIMHPASLHRISLCKAGDKLENDFVVILKAGRSAGSDWRPSAARHFGPTQSPSRYREALHLEGAKSRFRQPWERFYAGLERKKNSGTQDAAKRRLDVARDD